MPNVRKHNRNLTIRTTAFRGSPGTVKSIATNFVNGLKRPKDYREIANLDERVSIFADQFTPLSKRDEIEAAIFDGIEDTFGITADQFEYAQEKALKVIRNSKSQNPNIRDGYIISGKKRDLDQQIQLENEAIAQMVKKTGMRYPYGTNKNQANEVRSILQQMS